MKNINNNHGFTLVELLAVIVVLAIVMLVAVQSVLPQMEKARRRTLALDAQTAIEAANTYFMNNSLSDPTKGFPTSTGESNGRCVAVKTLIDNAYFSTKGNYDGSVLVYKEGNQYLFKVWLHKDQLMIPGAGVDEASKVNVQIKAGEENTDTFAAGTNDVVPHDATNWADTATGDNAIKGNSCGGKGTIVGSS